MKMIQFLTKYKRIAISVGFLAALVVVVLVATLPQSRHSDATETSSRELEIALLLENYRNSYETGLITKEQFDKIVAVLEACDDDSVLEDASLEALLSSIAASEETEAPTEESEQPTEEPTTEAPTEEPTTEEITTEEPTTEEPTTEEPTTEEPTTEAPQISVLDNYSNLAVVIAPNYLNVREQPTTRSKVIGKLFKHSGVDLLEASPDGQWYHIVSNEVDGWINAGFIVTGEEAATLAMQVAFPGIKVTARLLNVRSGPSLDDEVITQISRGSIFVVTGLEGDWIKISLSSEDEGYVHSDYIDWNYMLSEAVPYEEPVYVNPVRLNLINTAMEYLGGKYVWGGTTLGKGVDCSGFVMRIFEIYGYDLQRTAASQAAHDGVEVPFDQMKPGDLVFYWSNRRNCIGHVAIYIGNGMIVHAASENRGIVIDRYDYMTPLFAKNIIGE